MSTTARRLQLTDIVLPFIIGLRNSRRYLLWCWRPLDIVMPLYSMLHNAAGTSLSVLHGDMIKRGHFFTAVSYYV